VQLNARTLSDIRGTNRRQVANKQTSSVAEKKTSNVIEKQRKTFAMHFVITPVA